MTELNPKKLEVLTEKVMNDAAGALAVLMAYLGDQAGVYAAMDKAGPLSSEDLAKRTGLNERYLREWLSANAIAGYVDYDKDAETFSLSEEQATVFTREGQPTCLQGFFENIVSIYETYDKAVETFKSGKGRPWSDHSQCCFCSVDRFFRPGYNANLADNWIPALAGVEEKLKSGGKIADIGCGFGSSTILMAKTYPNSKVIGIDFHAPSIEAARQKARDENLSNVEFVVARAQDFKETDFDFACIFDALHDMGDPIGAAQHIKSALKPNGTFMVVEPAAGDTLADNMGPINQIFYSGSTMVCLPASFSQEGQYGLGAQAGEARLTKVLKEGGFTNVRRATETPTNIILECRP